MKTSTIIWLAMLLLILIVGLMYSTRKNQLTTSQQDLQPTEQLVDKELISPDCPTIEELDQCIPERVLFQADGFFKFKQSKLTRQAVAQLKTLAMKIEPGTVVEVTGYADRIGRAHHNMILSEKRANAVANYLRTKVSATFITKGMGETYSISGCKSRVSGNNLIDCLKPDRRIEILYTSAGVCLTKR
jgi:outer membrane protein OmpA-like peptidoglycan-associated protein